MSRVGVRKLKSQLTRYLRRVKEGEEIVITAADRQLLRAASAEHLEALDVERSGVS